MTPEALNALMSAIANGLRGAPEIESVEIITQADSTGTEPEIAVTVSGQELVLVASPL